MEPIKAFVKVFSLFDNREIRNSIVMFILIVIGAIAETIGVSVVLPFVKVVLDPPIIEEYDFLKTILELEFIGSYKRFVLLMCLGLILIFALKSLYMFFLLYIQNRFALNRQIVMAKRLFRSYMKKPYHYFFKVNSAELQRNVTSIVPNVINGLLMPGLSLLTEILIVLFILIVLMITDPASALTITALLAAIGCLYYVRIKNTIGSLAVRLNEHVMHMYKCIIEGIGSIKEVKVMGREDHFINIYDENSKGYAKATAFYNLANQSPRLLIETVAVCGIVVIVLVNVLNGSNINNLLPVLALFAMAAIRIMPSMNRILGYMTSLKMNVANLELIYDDVFEAKMDPELNHEQKANSQGLESTLPFDNCITVTDLTYKYPNTKENVLEQANMTIKKGQSVGIIGPSGAGKTTLVDLLLGLLEPTEGAVSVDGVDIIDNIQSWRKNLGYVPQSIFLTDDTILNNVAFGIIENQIDTDKVWAALEAAQLRGFVEKLPDKLHTKVGQSGMLLSGGQRQRIGIARALYHDPAILILDEATSALDSEVEKLISEAIATIGKSKTLIIIAHRLNTLNRCDVIYKVDGGKILCQN